MLKLVVKLLLATAFLGVVTACQRVTAHESGGQLGVPAVETRKSEDLEAISDDIHLAQLGTGIIQETGQDENAHVRTRRSPQHDQYCAGEGFTRSQCQSFCTGQSWKYWTVVSTFCYCHY